MVFIVEDEKDINELVCTALDAAGFTSSGFTGGEDFFNAIEKKVPDLVILDIMLPGMDGFEICRKLRESVKTANLPVIMLTAKCDELDRILGLELGADDYITKPFSSAELCARVKAVLRRYSSQNEAETGPAYEQEIVIDLQRYRLFVRQKEIKLTITELKILSALAAHPGWVYSREQILSFLWGDDRYSIDRTIDVHIRHLRMKLGETGNLVENVRGVGYRLHDKASVLVIKAD